MFLIVAPCFDSATEYTRKWVEEVKQEIVNQGYEFLFLNDRVTRKDVEEMLKKEVVDTLIFYDHGNEDCLWANESEKAIDMNNVDLLKGKDVYTLACLSAKKLGVEAFKKDCNIYIGYEEEFVFNAEEEELFKECANSGILKKLKDKVSWKEAYNYMIATFNECINKAKNFWTQVWLAHDRDCLRKYDKEQPPETKCVFRKFAVKLFGEKGWHLRKMILNFFRGILSYWHVFLGIVSGIFASIKILLLPIASLLLFLLFVIYQIIEEESEVEKIGDFAEFFIGTYFGYLIYKITTLWL